MYILKESLRKIIQILQFDKMRLCCAKCWVISDFRGCFLYNVSWSTDRHHTDIWKLHPVVILSSWDQLPFRPQSWSVNYESYKKSVYLVETKRNCCADGSLGGLLRVTIWKVRGRMDRTNTFRNLLCPLVAWWGAGSMKNASSSNLWASGCSHRSTCEIRQWGAYTLVQLQERK